MICRPERLSLRGLRPINIDGLAPFILYQVSNRILHWLVPDDRISNERKQRSIYLQMLLCIIDVKSPRPSPLYSKIWHLFLYTYMQKPG